MVDHRHVVVWVRKKGKSEALQDAIVLGRAAPKR
jgi:hypothetical protein